MNHLVKELNLNHIFTKIDSCGTSGYHNGEDPDSRCIKVSKRLIGNEIIYSKSRRISNNDLETFDYIFCCDKQNYADVISLNKKLNKNFSKISLLGSYDPEGVVEVRDPYFDSNDSGFETNFYHIERSLRHFINQVLERGE